MGEKQAGVAERDDAARKTGMSEQKYFLETDTSFLLGAFFELGESGSSSDGGENFLFGFAEG